MKAIETNYMGYRFRSRTEARWAVFFNRIAFQWEYEPQGYLLDAQTPCLPDFKLVLPGDRMVFCSIKPEEADDFDNEELRKLHLLADGTESDVLLLTGPPTHRAYNMVRPGTTEDVLSLAFFQDYEPYVNIADDYWFAALSFDERTGRHHFKADERRLGKAFGRGYIQAVEAARSARFEHGENPH